MSARRPWRHASACLLAAGLGLAASTLPALADDHGQRGPQGHRGGPERGGERRPQLHRRGFDHPYLAPMYAPPPVYYQPQQSPGISLFLPLDIRR